MDRFFAGIFFYFLIAIARYTTWKEKRDAGKVDLQGGRFKWPVMVMTYIASCMSVWVIFRRPGRILPLRTGLLLLGDVHLLHVPDHLLLYNDQGMAGQPAKALHHPGGFLLLPVRDHCQGGSIHRQYQGHRHRHPASFRPASRSGNRL